MWSMKFPLDYLPGSSRPCQLLLSQFISESKIWEQLGLSTILHPQNASLEMGSISLRLNYDEPSILTAVGSRPWSYTTTDIMTPEALLCSPMEQLKVCLAFQSTLVGNQPSKRVKQSPLHSVIAENFTKPLEITQSVTPTTSSIIKLGPREKISGILKECSENLYLSLTLHAIPALSQLSSFVSSDPFFNNSPTPRHTISSKRCRKKRGKFLTKSPNTRTVSLDKKGDDCMPLKDAATDEMLLVSGDEGEGTSASKNNSSSSLAITSLPRKRHAPEFNHGNNSYVLDPTVSCKLVSEAMRAMIAGSETRQWTRKGVKIDNFSSTSATSLASLSPVMFSPGFKKSVAHNSHYVPRIIQMMTSLARNAQTPSLRQKLAQIANMSTSQFSYAQNDRNINGEPGSEKRLAAVVQARLWSMMQRTLHDPLAARQATNKRSNPDDAIVTEEDDGYDDLLETIGTENNMEDLKMVDYENHSEKSAFDCILSDYDGSSGDEFDDLLEDEDEILLNDEERERMAIESETEEMFFGRRWQLEDAEPYDDLLFVVEGSSYDDELLLEEKDGALGEELSFGNDAFRELGSWSDMSSRTVESIQYFYKAQSPMERFAVMRPSRPGHRRMFGSCPTNMIHWSRSPA
ncbi:hypothetical protein NHQ30_008724 [Ciborinia camelliae]|nr:hypothetical protein NHQ30_008724 [Ciborinia camelliae]